MKKIELGPIISILANLGVIAGIVFLGYELRQNNESLQAAFLQARIASSIETAGQQSEWMVTLATDSASLDIYHRGMGNFYDLLPHEQTRFDLLMRSYLIRLAIGRTTVEVGLGQTGSEFEARSVAGLLEQEGFRQWWANTDRRQLPMPIVKLLNELGEAEAK